jgi:RHS repeat-associated protein
MLMGIDDFLNSHNDLVYPNPPRAYLNWILFDEQFKFVPSGSGFIRVGYYEDLKLQTLAKEGLPVVKSGYLFVYLSNEVAAGGEAINVFFDNLTVQHYTGPLTEETQYYPFGLVQAGISSKAALKLENRHKYNGIELEKDLDLNVYDAQFRELDAQIGRWWQIDPKTDEMLMWSTYASNYDNPIRFADPLGDAPDEECCPGAIGLWQWVAQTANANGPIVGKPILVGGAVVVTGYALWEAIKPTDAEIAATNKAWIESNAQISSVGSPFTMGTTTSTSYQKAKPAAPAAPTGLPVTLPGTPTNALKPGALLKMAAGQQQGKFNGQQSTNNKTSRQAFRNAKDQNGVPRSQQPKKSYKTKDKNTGKDLPTYDFTNSNGEKITIRKDQPITYPDGGSQGQHYNAGNPNMNNGKLRQHHNFDNNKEQ